MILRLLKQKAPDEYNTCILKLEKNLREEVNRSLEIYRNRVLDEIFGYDFQEAETQEVSIPSDMQELPVILADSASESEDAPDYAEGDCLLSRKTRCSSVGH